MESKEILTIPFVLNEKISNICTYKTQGKVKGVFYPQNEKQLILVYDWLYNAKIPFKIIGNGSNLLIKEDCKCLFISTKQIKSNILLRNNYAYISSSTLLANCFNKCYKKGLSGFENLATIPATIGGALTMNASCFGSSIFDIVEKIKIYKDGKEKFIKKDNILYCYHKTNLKDCLILSAKFKLKNENPCEILNKYAQIVKIRTEKQPKGLSCGSVFKNPPNTSAGALIEKCGLKGLTKNNAKISEKHGNFIINTGNSTFDDIKYLIDKCQEEVYRKFNIYLEKEVEIIQ